VAVDGIGVRALPQACYSTIAETVFITNEQEAQWLKTPGTLADGTEVSRQQQIAEALEQAINHYFTSQQEHSTGLRGRVPSRLRPYFLPLRKNILVWTFSEVAPALVTPHTKLRWVTRRG
jgi:hypothetical protein